MIEVQNLKKNYLKGDKFAGIGKDVGLSFNVNVGEIFGVIGPDGSGKSTLFRILASLLLPDSGTALLGGFDVVNDYKYVREIIGYMPGQFSLYQDLSVEENLRFFATVFNTTIEENYHLIKDIYSHIEPFKTRKAGNLSGGMKQKLALSCALIHKPQVLILDEPTTGVDPVSRKEFWDMLGRLKNQDITIIVSTAYMDEASRCDRIALMQDGDFIALDSPTRIVDNYNQDIWAVQANNMSASLKDLRNYKHVLSCFAFGDKHHITVDENFNPDYLHSYLNQFGYSNILIERITPTIEDCFLALTNEQ